MLDWLRNGSAISEREIPSAKDLESFVVRGGAADLQDAAYRYCRHTPGVDVVLAGTGSRKHLQNNIASMLRPPLDASTRDRLERLFGAVDTVSGQ